MERMSRQVKFFVCEVKTILGRKRDPVEKLRILLWFLFEYKNFQITSSEFESDINHLLVDDILQSRRGLPLPIAVLFQEISSGIGVKLDFVTYHGYRILKLVHRGKSFFVDIAERKILTAEDMLKLVNQHKQESKERLQALFEITSPQSVLRWYLESLRSTCERNRLHKQLLNIYDLILDLYPTSIRELGERALLLKEYGEHQLSSIDVKRYFSFVSFDRAPESLKKLKPKLSIID